MVVRYAASVSTREGAVSEAPALFHPIDACDDGAAVAVAVAVAVADNAVTSRDVDRGSAAGWEREGRMTNDDRDDDDDDRDEEDEDNDEDNDDEDVLRC